MTQAVTPSAVHNTQVLDRLRAVTKAAEALARRGFVLTGIEIGPRNPTVWVEHTQACNALKAAPCLCSPACDTLVAPLDGGVQVQWRVRRLAS